MFFICCLCLLLLYVFMRFSVGITKSSSCLLGKTAIVTGANSGLGYYTVLNLASRGCKVIMADVADMEQSKRNIIKFTNNTNIITKTLDLSSIQSVRDFTSDILKSEPKLDILINNAGISASAVNRTKDGFHPVMQVNYFGPVLLTHLLLDLLKKSAPSRVVFTSSFMSFFNNLSVDNLNYDNSTHSIVSDIFIYCNSKYALLIASDMFAKKLRETGVTSNSINPGMMNTSLLFKFFSITDCPTLPKLLASLFMKVYSKSPWEGAQVLTHVAVSSKLQRTTGKHFWDCKPFLKPLGAYNEKFCKSIWDATEKYVKLAADERL